MFRKQFMKTFLIINLSDFGDVLLTNALCRSIKAEYPDSKVVFLVNKPYYEVARYMHSVDDVLSLDKRGKHKGLLGLLRFVFNCKLKNIDTAFIMYGNDRGILISWLLKAKNRISGTNKITKIFLTQHLLDFDNYKHTQDRNANFLKAVTNKKVPPVPIKYIPPESDYINNLLFNLNVNLNDELIGLCPLSSNLKRDLSLEITVDLINRLTKNKKTVLLTGTGEKAANYVNELRKSGCNNFVDLTNKTTISQLANCIQKCNAFISVDTGTLHLAYAVNVPVVAIFHIKEAIEGWAPKHFHKHILISENITAESIMNNLEILMRTNP